MGGMGESDLKTSLLSSSVGVPGLQRQPSLSVLVAALLLSCSDYQFLTFIPSRYPAHPIDAKTKSLKVQAEKQPPSDMSENRPPIHFFYVPPLSLALVQSADDVLLHRTSRW